MRLKLKMFYYCFTKLPKEKQNFNIYKLKSKNFGNPTKQTINNFVNLGNYATKLL